MPAIPIGAFVGLQSPEVVRDIYVFAAEHPEVLDYVPCFCNCQLMGHKGNTDCFVKTRDADNRVTWDEHGGT